MPVEISLPVVSDTTGAHPVYQGTLSVSLILFVDGWKTETWDLVNGPLAPVWNWSFNDQQQPIGVSSEITIGGIPEQSYGDYRLTVGIQNSNGYGGATRAIRLEMAADEFVGGVFDMQIVGISQSPANCLVPDFLFGIVGAELAALSFIVTFPDGSAYPANVPFDLPYPISPVTVAGSIDGETNDIILAAIPGQEVSIDIGYYLGAVPPEFAGLIGGYNCIITGTGSGHIDGQVSDDDVDTTIWMSEMTTGGLALLNRSKPSSPFTAVRTL